MPAPLDTTTRHRPRVGLFGLTGCAGDQLALINDDRLLLELAQRVEIVSFDMALSHPGDWEGELEIALVEGSVCSTRDRNTLLAIRQRTTSLVALGTCAVWGGIPAMAGRIPLSERRKAVYGDAGALPDALEAQPLSAFVTVDEAIPGCPVVAREVEEAIAAWLAGGEVHRTDWSVCADCRMRENVCLVQTRGVVCCGPVTAGGCGAQCPAFGQPCTGCRGPVDDPAWEATRRLFGERGLTKEQVIQALQRYSAPAWIARHLAPRFAADPRRRGVGGHQGG